MHEKPREKSRKKKEEDDTRQLLPAFPSNACHERCKTYPSPFLAAKVMTATGVCIDMVLMEAAGHLIPDIKREDDHLINLCSSDDRHMIVVSFVNLHWVKTTFTSFWCNMKIVGWRCHSMDKKIGSLHDCLQDCWLTCDRTSVRRTSRRTEKKERDVCIPCVWCTQTILSPLLFMLLFRGKRRGRKRPVSEACVSYVPSFRPLFSWGLKREAVPTLLLPEQLEYLLVMKFCWTCCPVCPVRQIYLLSCYASVYCSKELTTRVLEVYKLSDLNRRKAINSTSISFDVKESERTLSCKKKLGLNAFHRKWEQLPDTSWGRSEWVKMNRRVSFTKEKAVEKDWFHRPTTSGHAFIECVKHLVICLPNKPKEQKSVLSQGLDTRLSLVCLLKCYEK